MRDRREIEREMYRARQDLDASLGELKHVVQEKIDVKARAKHALDEKVDELKAVAHEKVDLAKAKAQDLLYRGRDASVAMYYKGRYNVGRAYDRSVDKVKERPYVSAAILGGVILATVGVFFLIHRRNQRLI